tara:strand:- start:1471 stop:2169 length:699 start_codon:yes stop_codon:yes gene_type:complete
MNENLKTNFKAFFQEFSSYCSAKNSNAKLLAVSKTMPLSDIVALTEEGQKMYGENYAQELRDKSLENQNNQAQDIEWHYIGQIQKNKIKYIVGTAKLIHTVDSYEKAKIISEISEKKILQQNILLQVNISEDSNKAGVPATDLKHLIPKIKSLGSIKLDGLMTITENFNDPEKSRDCYRKMKALGQDFADSFDKERHDLSMGMSNDYKVAIDEGATIVRIGTKIFGKRKKIL